MNKEFHDIYKKKGEKTLSTVISRSLDGGSIIFYLTSDESLGIDTGVRTQQELMELVRVADVCSLRARHDSNQNQTMFEPRIQ